MCILSDPLGFLSFRSVETAYVHMGLSWKHVSYRVVKWMARASHLLSSDALTTAPAFSKMNELTLREVTPLRPEPMSISFLANQNQTTSLTR